MKTTSTARALSSREKEMPAAPQVLTFPITPEYVSNWTVPKAISEAVSNAFDETSQIRFEWNNGWLEIEDDGPGLPRKGLLLGFSTKRADASAIGQFGEGTALLLLTLARTKTPITIETVGFTVTPRIAYDANVDADVLQLCFGLSPRKKGTLIRIKTSQKVANDVASRFLRFAPDYTPPEEPGRIVPGMHGKVFIGGVLVRQKTDNYFSYDLALGSMKESLNRDRTFLDEWALERGIRNTVSAIREPQVMVELLQAAMKGKCHDREVRFDLTLPAVRRVLAESREALLGDGLVAVATHNAQANANAEYQGYTVLAKEGRHIHSLRLIFQAMGVPTTDKVAKNDLTPKEQMRRHRVRRVEWTPPAEITTFQQANLDRALSICTRLFGADNIGTVKVASTTSDSLKGCVGRWCNGFYDPNPRGGVIGIHHEILDDASQVLKTLVHEIGHRRAHRSHDAGHDYGDRSAGFEKYLVDMVAEALIQLEKASALPEESVRTPKSRAVALVREAMAERKLSKSGLARHAYTRPSAVDRLVKGLPPARPVDIQALGAALSLDGNILGIAFLSEIMRTTPRLKKGRIWASTIVTTALSLLEDIENQHKSAATACARIRAHIQNPVAALTDEEIYAPYHALLDIVEPLAKMQFQEHAQGTRRGLAASRPTASRGPQKASRHRARHTAPE